MNCPDCDDSPLSITSNILGILTFAAGLFLSFAAFVTITRNASNEIQDLYTTLDQTDKHIQFLKYHFRDLEGDSDPLFNEMQDAMVHLYILFRAACQDVRNHLRTFGHIRERVSERRVSTSAWDNVRWWYYEKDTAAKIAKLDGYRQHFTAIQLTFMAR